MYYAAPSPPTLAISVSLGVCGVKDKALILKSWKPMFEWSKEVQYLMVRVSLYIHTGCPSSLLNQSMHSIKPSDTFQTQICFVNCICSHTITFADFERETKSCTLGQAHHIIFLICRDKSTVGNQLSLGPSPKMSKNIGHCMVATGRDRSCENWNYCNIMDKITLI